MLDVPCGGCSGSLNRSDCVYSYVCSVDVCQNPQEHQIGAYLHLCLYVCVCLFTVGRFDEAFV